MLFVTIFTTGKKGLSFRVFKKNYSSFVFLKLSMVQDHLKYPGGQLLFLHMKNMLNFKAYKFSKNNFPTLSHHTMQ